MSSRRPDVPSVAPERETSRLRRAHLLELQKKPDLDAQDALLSEPPVCEAFLGMLTVPTLADTLCAAYVCMLPASHVRALHVC